jgi:APA family basic amino acid/polyamine antiporter
LQSELTLFDVTNLVVGAIIGADIYVASSFGAGYLGPASLLVWVIAGVMAAVIALCFAQCARLLPKVGGSYAYAREAWGPFAGFMVGWSLWLAEWISLAVFPVAFTRYLMFFIPSLGFFYQTLVKVLFVLFLTTTNIVGVKAAGRTNDALTLLKLLPLILFSFAGAAFIFVNPTTALSNLSPFLPFGWANFGKALILIFWAYAGFELSAIPADEVRRPESTIPKAIAIGMSIVIVFYLVTNFVLFGVRPWTQLSIDAAPLASATQMMLSISPVLGLVGVIIVGGGALVSVAGSDESGMIGTSRLGYALAVDGLFPRAFAKLHSKYKTPYLGIVAQAVTALIASIYGELTLLVSTSVLFMAIAYLATCASIFVLKRKTSQTKPRGRLGATVPSLGIVFSLYLISQCSLDNFIAGLVLLAFGVLIYIKFSPQSELTELKQALLSRRSRLERAYEQEQAFIAYALQHVKRYYRRVTGKKQAWSQ